VVVFHNGINAADDLSASNKYLANLAPVSKPDLYRRVCAWRATRWALPRISSLKVKRSRITDKRSELFVDETEESFATKPDFQSPGKSVLKKVQSAAKKLGSLIRKSESPASKLTFHICALSRATVAAVKESLPAKLKGLVNKSEILNDAVSSLSPQDEQSIAALQSVDVGIEIGRFGRFMCLLNQFMN